MAYVFAITGECVSKVLAIGPAGSEEAQQLLLKYLRPLFTAAGIEAIPLGVAENVHGPADTCQVVAPAQLLELARTRHADTPDLLRDLDELEADLKEVELL